MELNEGLFFALVISKTLRKWVLIAAGVCLVVGLLMIPIIPWAVQVFHLAGGPRGHTSPVLIFLVVIEMGLPPLSVFLFVGAWLPAVIHAKIYRKAAEDGRDLAQELGFMDRD